MIVDLGCPHVFRVGAVVCAGKRQQELILLACNAVLGIFCFLDLDQEWKVGTGVDNVPACRRSSIV